MWEMKVEGMSCGSCVQSITRILRNIDPEAQVEVDLGTKTVKVRTVRSQEEVKSTLDEAGFPVLQTKMVG